MKKTYPTMIMLALMFAALSFISCGDDEEDDDDVIGGDTSINGDYLQVTFEGKTYTDKILDWQYAQIDPVGRDADNKPLTFTYDMCDHFEKHGFTFMFGVVHYSRKSDLLSSSTGSYGCSESMLMDDYFRNLTFWSTLEIDYNEYGWKSGTHQVNSIKEVGGDVQIEGSFTSNFEYDGNKRAIKGNYRITIP